MKRQFIFLIALISAIFVLVSWKAASGEELKLRLNPSDIVSLLDLQDKSLDELESEFNEMKSKIETLESVNSELRLQLSNSALTIQGLQGSLDNISKLNEQQGKLQRDLQKQLSEADTRYKAASVAGPIAGALTAAGIALIIYGAVNKNDPMLYTGVGLSGVTIVVWSAGKFVTKRW